MLAIIYVRSRSNSSSTRNEGKELSLFSGENLDITLELSWLE